MIEKSAEQQGLFVSLRVKLLVGFTLIFTVVFLGVFFWFDGFAEDIALQRIQEDMVDTLKAASAGLDGDELTILFNEGDPNAAGFSDHPLFQKHIEWLDTVHEIEPRAWPYTYVASDKPNEVIFLTDLYAKYDPSKAVKFEEPVETSGNLTNGLKETTLKLTPYTDEWGFWVSAYMPVKNQNGENIAGIGVDFLANYVLEVKQRVRNQLIIAFGILYAVLFALVFLASGAFSKPILTLTSVAAKIGEGDYNMDITALVRMGRLHLRDETDKLAEVFELMVGKVRVREESLKQQVAELKIEIDEVKRQKQVSEIVDTDFFQDLQVKARAMRQRSGQEQKEPGNNPPSS
jgi:methyl-accepting chemotaxis protein